MVMASSWSWVTWTKVMPTSVWMRLSSICICRRSLRSSAPSGSSSSSTCGRLISARASATRCCWPPESWRGAALAEAAELHQLEHVADLLLDVLDAASAQPEGDVLEDVQVREERVVLEDGVDRPLVRRSRLMSCPPMVMVPLVGSSSPAIIRSVVVLPQPGRAEQGEERPLLDGQVEVVDRGERAEPLGDRAQVRSAPASGDPVDHDVRPRSRRRTASGTPARSSGREP